MSWAARLLGVEGTGNDNDEVRTGIEEAHSRLLGLAQGLDRDAGVAPTAQSEQVLRAVAREDEALAAELKERLKALGIGNPVVSVAAAPLGAPNHWARLVEALEGHRHSRDSFLETAAQLGEVAPEIVPLFERLSRIEEAHLHRLRDLVARADPQALD